MACEWPRKINDEEAVAYYGHRTIIYIYIYIHNIFPHYLINGTFFRKKLLDIKCGSLFFTRFVWNNIHSKKNWVRYDKNVYSSSCKVPVVIIILFYETWNFLIVLRKILKYQISRKSVQWDSSCSMWTNGWKDGRTGLKTLILAFRSFAKAPKNAPSRRKCL